MTILTESELEVKGLLEFLPRGGESYFHLISFKVRKENEFVVAHGWRPGLVQASHKCQGKENPGPVNLTLCLWSPAFL